MVLGASRACLIIASASAMQLSQPVHSGPLHATSPPVMSLRHRRDALRFGFLATFALAQNPAHAEDEARYAALKEKREAVERERAEKIEAQTKAQAQRFAANAATRKESDAKAAAEVAARYGKADALAQAQLDRVAASAAKKRASGAVVASADPGVQSSAGSQDPPFEVAAAE